MTAAATDSPLILLHPADDVAVARRAITAGTELLLPGGSVVRSAKIGFGHKVAVRPIAAGAPVRKFGQTIGEATADIAPGELVHGHNLAAGRLTLDYAIGSEVPPPPEPIVGRTFQGIRRPDGRAATRNYVAIVSTVNCSATTAKRVASQVSRELLDRYPNVDGVIALTHKGGCATQYGGEDHRQLARTLAGFAKHANVGAYLLLGLGCETAPIGFLAETHGLVQLNGKGGEATRGLPSMTIQEYGGVRKTTAAAVAALADLLPEADRVRREPIPASELILGLECGGSDGNSGVTANPALGVASDLLVAAGGTAILAETSEIYGGEHLLTRRAINKEVGDKLIGLVRWWEDYAGRYGVKIDNNPSPGNKAGGLTTIYEKSLGAIAKGGSTALRAVYNYAEPVTQRGFVFMDTPGYDPASVTGMVAGGANLIAFTTGRGSCFGFKPVPSLKICTNTPTYRRMEEDMDLDAGVILSGVPVEEVGRRIFETLLAVASGQKTKSEAQDIGDEEFCPWSIGPTL